MNDYLVELYSWIQANDATFNQRYSYEDFENNMQDMAYADEMYQWIASKDNTFAGREPINVWSEKIKKKKILALLEKWYWIPIRPFHLRILPKTQVQVQIQAFLLLNNNILMQD